MKTNGRDDEMARRTAEWSLVNSSVITRVIMDMFIGLFCFLHDHHKHGACLWAGMVTCWLVSIAHVVSHLGMRGMVGHPVVNVEGHCLRGA